MPLFISSRANIWLLASAILVASSSIQATTITEIIDTTGDGISELLLAGGLGIDGSGNVYVTGRFSVNAFKITPEGVITEIIDSTGDGMGNPLAQPIGIAVDGMGNVYVTGFCSHNVFKITPLGVISQIIDSTGDGMGNPLAQPVGIAVDGMGNVYVTGWASQNVFKITPLGVISQIIDSNGDGLGNGLNGPSTLAIDGDGNVFVAGEVSDNAFKIMPGGVITKIIDQSGDGMGNGFIEPAAIETDDSGNVYVAGRISHNVFQITPGGVITQIVDVAGDGTNPLNGPSALATDALGNVFVSCEISNNAFLITPDGSIQQLIDENGDGMGNQLSFPVSDKLGAGSLGLVYVCGHISGNVFRIDFELVTPGFIQQFGTPGADAARAVVVDDTGIYVAGVTSGTLPGQTNAGGTDAFVRRYSLSGDVLWTRQFGSNLDDVATGIGFTPAGVDPPGIFVGGETAGALPGETSAGGIDGFVLRYDLGGEVIWTQQFGTAGDEVGIVILNGPTVFVTGSTTGAFPGQNNAGGLDAFYLQIDADGNQTFVDQFGTPGDDRGLGIEHTLSESPPGFDRVFISGETSGTFPGETNAGGTDAFLRSYDAGGAELWTRQFGSALDDSAEGVGIPDGVEGVIVVGTTAGTLPGQTSAGGSDAFLMRYDLSGNVDWTLQFGTPGNEHGGIVLNSPAIFVAGETTGAFLGQSNAGGVDTFYRKFDLNGNVIVTTQFGTAGDDQHLALGASPDYTRIFIVGETDSAFEGETNAGLTDAFLVELITPTEEEEAPAIPAVSTWGLVALMTLFVTGGTLVARTSEQTCEVRGVQHGRRATNNTNPAHFDTLALAQHLTGDTPAAIRNQRKALSLLPSDAPDRSDYEARLASFQATLLAPVESKEVSPGQ